MKHYFLSLTSVLAVILLFLTSHVKSQVVRSLNTDWIVYDEKSGLFYPFVSSNTNELPLHIKIDAKEYKGMVLTFKSTEPISIYVNNKFARQCVPNRLIEVPIDSISSSNSQPLLVAFYGKFNSNLIDSVAISDKSKAIVSSNSKLDIPMLRVENMTRSYFSILLIVSFLFFVLIKNFNTKVYRQYFSLANLFTDSNSDSLQSRGTFDGHNFSFILMGVMFFALASISFPAFSDTGSHQTFIDYLGSVLHLMFVVSCFYILKYLATFIVSWLFSINKFATAHYMVFVRVSIIWSLTLLIIAMLNYSQLSWVNFQLLFVFLITSLFFLTLTSIKVSILINHVAKVSTLYLISYLCITEWLPYFIIVKLYMVYFY